MRLVVSCATLSFATRVLAVKFAFSGIEDNKQGFSIPEVPHQLEFETPRLVFGLGYPIGAKMQQSGILKITSPKELSISDVTIRRKLVTTRINSYISDLKKKIRELRRLCRSSGVAVTDENCPSDESTDSDSG